MRIIPFASKKTIIRKIILLFGLLIMAIIVNAAFSTYRENKAVNQRISMDLEAKLSIAAYLEENESEKLAMISGLIREQNQKFAHFTEYDKVGSITIMLETIARHHDIDLLFFFDEDGNLLTTNRRAAADIADMSIYNSLISDRRERTGVEKISPAIVAGQLPEYGKSDADFVCFKSVINLLHDTGDIYAYVVLVNLINNNRNLMDQLAKMTEAQVVFYDQGRKAVLTSFPGPQPLYPAKGTISMQGKSYFTLLKKITDYQGQTVGELAVAIDRQPFAERRRQLLLNSLLPFVISGVICIVLFFLLKVRVFDKINQFMITLRSVAEGKGDLTVRLPVPGKKNTGTPLDELESMGMDFNRMMGKLENTYTQLIAAREQAEHSQTDLAKANETMKTLFGTMPFGVIVVGSDKKIRTINKAALSMMGYESEDDIIGKVCHQNLCPTERGKCPFFDLKQRLEKSERFLITREGSLVPILKSALPITLDGESVLLEAFIDITEIKQARELAEAANIGLEKRVEKRTAEILQANEKLKQEMAAHIRVEKEKNQLEGQLQRAGKMEAIGTLAGGVAHDLNNILSGIVSYPDFLLLDLPGDSKYRQPLLTIKKSGEKAAAIVQDLLTLARRGVSVSEPVNLNQIVSEYLNSPEFAQLKQLSPNIEVQTSQGSDLSVVIGSPVHLSKCLMNLVSNAFEAMSDDGTLRLCTENRRVRETIIGKSDIADIVPGDYVILIVADTGTGISSQDLERIFEPFYTKKVMGRSGTGLGMSVVWGTVKDHKGYIDIQTAEGEGTTFMLYFPAGSKEDAPERVPLSIDDLMGAGESILVVDDLKEQREIAASLLERLGYKVITVSSGEEAVEYLTTNTVDLLMLDMIMEPGIDGLETYRRIRTMHPEQKAFIVSGFSESSRIKELQRLSGGEYLKKPYSLETIGTVVKLELEKK